MQSKFFERALAVPASMAASMASRGPTILTYDLPPNPMASLISIIFTLPYFAA
jgi:hypothetical protein